MSKDDVFEVEGTVEEVLPNTVFTEVFPIRTNWKNSQALLQITDSFRHPLCVTSL